MSHSVSVKSGQFPVYVNFFSQHIFQIFKITKFLHNCDSRNKTWSEKSPYSPFKSDLKGTVE